ncbi:hypothetical protein DH2020_004135 [Rehmannia glutinosa]|uniref:Protein OSB1, mitochondrial n=1 Tax=Rehmannia glutinosa TaxID=99300 RepID=A0ABR0XNP2_REHGL
MRKRWEKEKERSRVERTEAAAKLNLKHETTRKTFQIELRNFMGAARFLLLRFKNAASNSARPFSSSAALVRRPWTHLTDEQEDSGGESSVYRRALRLQRPTTIRCEESLHNSVSLIGAIERPLKVCNSVKFGVYTILKVNAPTGAYGSLWVMLKFWEEMAEMSVQHLKPNDFVYVSGRLGSYVKVDDNGKSVQHYEVRNATFVNNYSVDVSYEDIKQKRRDRLHLWQVFFANPSEWWDNRNHKSNPKLPDFKHKDTGEVLWLKDNDPPWVHKQLQLHDSRLYKRSPGEHINAWSHLSPLVYE